MESGAGFGMLVPPALFLALHFVESNFLSPLIMGHRLRISPVFVFLSVLLWSWLWGIAGAFVAVPLLLALRAVSQRSRRLRWVRIYLDADAPMPTTVGPLLGLRRDAALEERRPRR